MASCPSLSWYPYRSINQVSIDRHWQKHRLAEFRQNLQEQIVRIESLEKNLQDIHHLIDQLLVSIYLYQLAVRICDRQSQVLILDTHP
jgi:hypothetical protein